MDTKQHKSHYNFLFYLYFLIGSLLSPTLHAGITADVINLNAAIVFIDNEKEKTLELRDMLTNLRPMQLRAYNPVEKEYVTYLGFPLKDVVRLAGFHMGMAKDISFVANDGYKAVLTGDVLKKYPNPVLAYRQLNTKNGLAFDWIQGGKEQLDPAPYYLVWDDPKSYDDFPWPFAINEIIFSYMADPFFEIRPTPSASSSVRLGFDIFMKQCIGCHSINLIGGEVGPELNIPKNVTEYLPRDFLLAFLQDPTSFIARSRMQDVHLTSQEAKEVLSYISYMKKRKAKEKHQPEK